MRIPDGKTKWAAVVATPIEHSLSPLIHNTAFDKLDINATYLAFDVTDAYLKEALVGLKVFNGLGLNLSMPHKTRALSLVDEVSEEARLIGALNTIVNDNGKLKGFNTDGIGLVKSLESEGVVIDGKTLTVLGAGGAGISIIVSLALSGSKKISVFKRLNDSFNTVKETIEFIAQETKCEIELIPFEEEELLSQSILISDILINTTNVGMGDSSCDTLVKDTTCFSPSLAVVDIIYNPKETTLLRDAKKMGCHTINGIGMLVYQAAEAFKLWTGQEMPITEVKKALSEYERNLEDDR